MVSSKSLSQQTKNVFNVSNKITSIASIDVFIVISWDFFFFFFEVKSEIFAGIAKFQGFL